MDLTQAESKTGLRFQMLFNAAHDAIFMMDNRTFVDCNPATLRIFQCTREQIVGQTPYRFSPKYQPDGRLSEESAMEKINAAIAGNPQSFDWQHIRYDGTPFEAEVSLNRLDLGGEIFIQAIVRDVSERKLAEEENKKLAVVANTTTNMVVLADAEGKVMWVNPAFTRTTGYQLEEIVGKKPGSFLIGPGSDPQVSKLMGRHIAMGEGFKDVEIINYTKDGKPFWVSIEVQPIHNSEGKVIQFVAIESDITERKAIQQALLDRNEELMKANAELDRFVYSASHDLRAPIASLLGLIEVARMEKDPATMDRLLQMQKRSLQRMDQFIKDIVDHSRNTRLPVEPEPIDFQHVVQETFEHLQFMDNFEKIRRVVSVCQEGKFFTSSSRLLMIVNNLVSNAIKYADVHKVDPFIEVSVKADQSKAFISITDNGEGISEEALPNVFRMFYRGSTSGTGSGLGLYIVKEAVHKVGGTIKVNSSYGKGTRFEVELPSLRV